MQEYLLLAAVTLVLTGCIAPQTQQPSPPTVPVTATPALGDTRTRPADGMVMLYVPGGTFQMGSTEAEVEAAEDRDDQTGETAEPEPAVELAETEAETDALNLVPDHLRGLDRFEDRGPGDHRAHRQRQPVVDRGVVPTVAEMHRARGHTPLGRIVAAAPVQRPLVVSVRMERAEPRLDGQQL